jgi:hypothetical protein
MFQFPRCPPSRYGLARRYVEINLRGLPHSEIPGYACSQLAEAYRSDATSFIGPRRLGIHPAPLIDCVARYWASVRGPALRDTAEAGRQAVIAAPTARRGPQATAIPAIAVTRRKIGGDVDQRPQSLIGMN